MADTLQLWRIPSWSTLTEQPVKVMPETDKDPPTAEAGDEIWGNLGDETGDPEDPSAPIVVELPRLIYGNRNPRRPCPVCRPYVGTVWQLGCQPRIPPRRHYRALADDHGARVPVAHGFAEASDIRMDAEVLLRPAQREPEAGFNLVENEDHAVVVGQFPDPIEVPLTRPLALHRLDDYPGHFTAVLLEKGFQGIQIVIRH